MYNTERKFFLKNHGHIVYISSLLRLMIYAKKCFLVLKSIKPKPWNKIDVEFYLIWQWLIEKEQLNEKKFHVFH